MVVVVTGCSRGIGFGLIKLLSNTHKVYCVSRNIDSIKELKSQISSPENLSYFQGDICKLNKKNIDDWIKEDSVDVLINNAGLLINKPFLSQTYDDYKSVFDVNLFGTINMTQLLVDKLINSSNGQVLNIGSIGGVQGSSKYPGLSVYSSSKAAVSILTECLALELKEFNIKVNCLALGAVQTEMLNDAFPGYRAQVSVDQMSEYILNFISNGSLLTNGQIIPVNLSNP